MLILLIAREGLPLAIKLYEKWGSQNVVTPAEIEELRVLGAQTAKGELLKALALQGIPIDDPRAIALLKLVK